MQRIFRSKAAQLALLVAIFIIVTISVAVGTQSWTPFTAAVVWLPAMYVAIYHRKEQAPAGEPS